MRLFLLLFIIMNSVTTKAQQPSFEKLRKDAINAVSLLNNHLGSEELIHIDSIGLPREYAIEAIDINGDSVYGYDLNEIYRFYAEELLLKLFSHPDIIKYNFNELGFGEEAVVSEDGKFQMLSFYENHGGTYRSKMSFIQFRPESGKMINLHENGNEQYYDSESRGFLYPDGYHTIDQVDSKEGVKYLLRGFVRGCSYCFQEYIQLVHFKDNKFHLNFEYSTNSRSWDETMWLSKDLQELEISYHTDDLTSECECEEVEEGTKSHYDNDINCRCLFLFDGYTYQPKN